MDNDRNGSGRNAPPPVPNVPTPDTATPATDRAEDSVSESRSELGRPGQMNLSNAANNSGQSGDGDQSGLEANEWAVESTGPDEADGAEDQGDPGGVVESVGTPARGTTDQTLTGQTPKTKRRKKKGEQANQAATMTQNMQTIERHMG